MELATTINQYFKAYINKHGKGLLPNQLKTIHAIQRCRTPKSGELYIKCPDCNHAEWRPMSCGNRHCPKCQNHISSQWIDKQQVKLLPVPYFMVTFTVPYELRALIYRNQKAAYKLLFDCSISTLKSFGHNPKHLNGEIGATLVLHTNSRNLNYHPHIHAVIPGGGINKRTRNWKKVTTNYLFSA
ncbi:MAG: transposase zinc-binding domain-containing protein [Desulfotalea sp.]